MKREPEYTIDDSIYAEGGHMDRIMAMTDEEFEQYIAEEKSAKKKQRLENDLKGYIFKPSLHDIIRGKLNGK